MPSVQSRGADLSFRFGEDRPADPLWITEREMKKVKLLSQRLWESPGPSHETYFVCVVQIPLKSFHHGYHLNCAAGILRHSVSGPKIVNQFHWKSPADMASCYFCVQKRSSTFSTCANLGFLLRFQFKS